MKIKSEGRIVILPGGIKGYLEDGKKPADYMTITKELAYCDTNNVVHKVTKKQLS